MLFILTTEPRLNNRTTSEVVASPAVISVPHSFHSATENYLWYNLTQIELDKETLLLRGASSAAQWDARTKSVQTKWIWGING